jgi:hypothetical protein
MDAVNFIAPLEAIPNIDEKEEAYQAILSRLFNGSPNVLTVNDAILLINGAPLVLGDKSTQGLFNQALLDLLNYGCPHLGSPDVVERFSKQDGLVALRQSASTNTLMRVMLANWQAHGSKRGLNFLTFVLDVLFPNQWQIIKLFHYVDFASQYPFFLTDIDNETTFPTSRIRITLADTIDANTAVELAPNLLRLIPANIVPSIAREPIDAPIGFKVAVAAKAIHIADYSAFN